MQDYASWRGMTCPVICLASKEWMDMKPKKTTRPFGFNGEGAA